MTTKNKNVNKLKLQITKKYFLVEEGKSFRI